jgi:hypothetical protein
MEVFEAIHMTGFSGRSSVIAHSDGNSRGANVDENAKNS